MARRTNRTPVPRDQAGGYAAKAENFMRAAELARDGGLFDSAALLYIHGSIAYADAACIHIGQVKSTSDQHMDAAHLLAEVAARSSGRDDALLHFRKLIVRKNAVAYDSPPVKPADLEALRSHAHRFRDWAVRVVEG